MGRLLAAFALSCGLPGVPAFSQTNSQANSQTKPELAFKFEIAKPAPPPQQPSPAPKFPDEMYRDADAKFSQDAFDPEAEALLRVDEAATKWLFPVPSLRLEQAATERVIARPQWGDVLMAKWSIDEKFGKGSLLLTDTPYFSEYVFRLDGCKIGSRRELADFVHALLGWHEATAEEETPPLKAG